jgi:serine/threonine-protein kinase
VTAGAPSSTGPNDSVPGNGATSSSPSGPTSGFPRIDKFELIEEIGHGGMATVYRAKDPRLGREVAVKVIHKHLRENPEVGTRFVAEARAAAKLRHPGIVDVFDVSSDEDAERYLVVELIRGCTLRKVLQKHKELPAEIGAAIVLRICDALQHAHASAIIHRDIKPENVLVELPADRAAVARESVATPRAPAVAPAPTPSRPSADPPSDPGDTQRSLADVVTPHGVRHAAHAKAEVRDKSDKPRATPRDDAGVVIKITDFGIAKILDAQGVTSTGQVLGSPAHMAPEQIEGGEVDARTDVFALGVLMYECLVGHLPFEGKNPAQVLRRVLEGSYSPADRERPSVGGRWARIVARALARDPEERTPSAEALGYAIKDELSALGIGDAKAEIDAYFADPEAHAEALRERLVPRLVARGEAARKAGDIPGAAADLNRALALKPDDLTILKRIGSLTSSASRRLLLRRAAAIAAGSAVLGLVAFGAARAWKARAAQHDPPLPVTAASMVETAPRPVADPPVRTVDHATVVPSGTSAVEPSAKRPPRVPASPGFTPAPPPPAAGSRMVRFNINPKGAKLSVDGAQQSWLSAFPLSVGQHRIEVSPNVEACCKKITTTINVEAGEPDSVLTVPLSMEIRPAQVTLSGAPPNGQLSCPEIALTCFAGAKKEVKLREPSWSGHCAFTSPDKPMRKAGVTINAGVVNAVPWPGD